MKRMNRLFTDMAKLDIAVGNYPCTVQTGEAGAPPQQVGLGIE